MALGHGGKSSATINWANIVDVMTQGDLGSLIAHDSLDGVMSGRGTFNLMQKLGKKVDRAIVDAESSQANPQGAIYGSRENDTILVSKTDHMVQQFYVHDTDAAGK